MKKYLLSLIGLLCLACFTPTYAQDEWEAYIDDLEEWCSCEASVYDDYQDYLDDGHDPLEDEYLTQVADKVFLKEKAKINRMILIKKPCGVTA